MMIGRERERAVLESLIASDKSEFVAVYGRRRVGKTFVSASGLKRNANAFDVQSVVTLDDLFA